MFAGSDVPESTLGQPFSSRPLAIFDLDGTLLRGDSLLPFLLRYGWRRRKWGLVLLGWDLLRYGSGFLSARSAKQQMLRRVLADDSAAIVRIEVDHFCQGWVPRHLNDKMVRQLREHQRAGHRVILLTASPSVYASAVAELLGIDEVICTNTRWVPETCAIEIVGENCKGAEKLRRLQSYLGKIAPPAKSYAYGDNQTDMPVLIWAERGYLLGKRGSLVAVSTLSDRERVCR